MTSWSSRVSLIQYAPITSRSTRRLAGFHSSLTAGCVTTTASSSNVDCLSYRLHRRRHHLAERLDCLTLNLSQVRDEAHRYPRQANERARRCENRHRPPRERGAVAG